MHKLPKDRRIWMYQLNPKRGRTFLFKNGNKKPTSAENLWEMLRKEGPISGDWYITINFHKAQAGDPVIVRVNDGHPGSKTGIVGFGHLSDVDPEERSIGIEFDMKVTGRLMKNPVSLREVRRVISKKRNNLGDVTNYQKNIGRWIFGGKGSPPPTKNNVSKLPKGKWTEITDNKPALPPKPGGGSKISLEEIAQKREQANRWHHSLLVGLKNVLIADGWQKVDQKPGSVDMRAEKGRVTVFFEAKTVNKKNESRQTRLALGQLYEYRYIHGNKDERLCIVLNNRPEKARLNFLDSLNIGVIWSDRNTFNGNYQGQRILKGHSND